jgi:hypothetical protein
MDAVHTNMNFQTFIGCTLYVTLVNEVVYARHALLWQTLLALLLNHFPFPLGVL